MVEFNVVSFPENRKPQPAHSLIFAMPPSLKAAILEHILRGPGGLKWQRQAIHNIESVYLQTVPGVAR